MAANNSQVPTICSSILEAMYRHARSEFPKECCGYLKGDGEQVEVVMCKNRQDELHALDSHANPRTSANGYNIGGRELLNMVRSFDSDQPVTIIYHSHPRVGAYFSKEDENAALAAGYPVDYLVIDVQEHEIGGSVLFRLHATTPPSYQKIAEFSGMKI